MGLGGKGQKKSGMPLNGFGSLFLGSPRVKNCVSTDGNVPFLIDPILPSRDFPFTLKKIRIGVIAAAGKGTRAYPRTSFIPKPLFVIEGKTILHRNVELMVKTFGIEKVYVLVGHLKEQIIAELDQIRLALPKLGIDPLSWLLPR